MLTFNKVTRSYSTFVSNAFGIFPLSNITCLMLLRVVDGTPVLCLEYKSLVVKMWRCTF